MEPRPQCFMPNPAALVCGRNETRNYEAASRLSAAQRNLCPNPREPRRASY